MGFPYDAVRRTVSDLISGFTCATIRELPRDSRCQGYRWPSGSWMRSCSARSTRLGGILVLGGLGASSEAVQIVERAWTVDSRRCRPYCQSWQRRGRLWRAWRAVRLPTLAMRPESPAINS